MLNSYKWNQITFTAALFRLCIGSILFIDLILLFPNADELLNNSFYNYNIKKNVFSFLRENIQIFLIFCGLIFILFLLGIGKRMVSLFTYIAYVVLFLLLMPAVTWGDRLLMYSLLFLSIVDNFHFFSVKKSHQPISFISKLGIFSIMLHICFIYAINFIGKIQNPSWLDGTAILYFIELSQAKDIFSLTNFLKQEGVYQFLAWGTLIFQATFPIFIWIKKMKWIWIFVGILMHLFMAFTLQLYKFEFIIITHYVLFFPDYTWLKKLWKQSLSHF